MSISNGKQKREKDNLKDNVVEGRATDATIKEGSLNVPSSSALYDTSIGYHTRDFQRTQNETC